MAVTYKNESVDKRTVYYAGTTTLKGGWLMCWNRNLKSGGSLDGAWTVEKPLSGNSNRDSFAGVVAPESDGQVTPGLIQIIEPGRALSAGKMVEVWTGVSCTATETQLGVVGGTFAAGAASSTNRYIAVAMETVNAVATPQAVLCELKAAGMADMVTPSAPTLTGGTTGGTVAVAGSTATLAADLKRLADYAAKNTVDIAAIITALKKAGIMKRA